MQMEWNEDYMDAKLLLMCYGHVVGTWGIKQMDDVGNEWLRYGLTKLGHKEIPEYTVYKVIDADGQKLPKFGEMVYTAKHNVSVSDIQGIIYLPFFTDRVKTYVQMMQGPGNAGVLAGGLAAFLASWIAMNVASVQKRPVADAAEEMSAKRSDSKLPSKLKGVFGDATNGAANHLFTLENSSFDADERSIWQQDGQPLSSAVANDCCGWLSYVLQRASWAFRASAYKYNFEDNYRSATRHGRAFFMPVPSSTVTLRQMDEEGHKWQLVKGDSIGKETVLRNLVKVVDGDGGKLPAFHEMVSARSAAPQLLAGKMGVRSLLVGLVVLSLPLGVMRYVTGHGNELLWFAWLLPLWLWRYLVESDVCNCCTGRSAMPTVVPKSDVPTTKKDIAYTPSLQQAAYTPLRETA
eukprot:TRINITY_DN3650_c0_g1_i3.p1 TRINITY_DN3650_c0_g1~~TRINITY_DN3650_c0_g1_i3.p1  ORF type:complete len:407 (-),score=76.31 TRINITY_DN3650_c0_g1_i3:502-1722(-)